MIPTLNLPSLDGLTTLLAPWHGASAYLIEYVGPREKPLGNNGDELLGRVFLAVLRDLGITLTSNPDRAEVLLVRPGGALLDRYQAPRLLTGRLAALPDLPLVIFPHSSWFETQDPAQMFAGRSAPTLWISREPRSHQHLLTSWGDSLAKANVSLALDHDVVASGHSHVRAALGLEASTPAAHGVLVVARLGVESGSMDGPLVRPPLSRRVLVAGFQRLPQRPQILLRRRVTRASQQAANARLLERAAPMLPAEVLTATPTEWSFDVSDPTLATFSQYVQALSSAAVVITDRLHVAMPAAILNKRTILVESGYHKLVGVFEHSLTGLDNVTFVRRA